MSSEDLLSIIAADVGMEIDEMLKEATFDSVAPGICTRCRNTVDNCEPDATNNWCDECDTPTVKSALVLAGCI
jgi:hypothetical protein